MGQRRLLSFWGVLVGQGTSKKLGSQASGAKSVALAEALPNVVEESRRIEEG